MVKPDAELDQAAVVMLQTLDEYVLSHEKPIRPDDKVSHGYWVLMLRDGPDGDLDVNAQRLLEALPVVIPFADKLTFPSSWLRTRRDYGRFLNLIEVSAFLHQHQRDRRGRAIVASTADYAVAYALAADVLAETLSDLRKPLREALERVRGLSLKGDGSVSRREVREALAVPDSTVRRWLSDLVELEYLAQAETSKGGAGRTSRYRLVSLETQRNKPLGLLTPEDLAARL